jgi:hypothetical protein
MKCGKARQSENSLNAANEMSNDPNNFPAFETLTVTAEFVDSLSSGAFTFYCLDPRHGKTFREEIRRIKELEVEKGELENGS